MRAVKSASDMFCTSGLLKGLSPMLLPMLVLALPSAPWHMAHFALKMAAPLPCANEMVGTAKTRARPNTANRLEAFIAVSSSPSQCRSLVWDEPSPERRKYSNSRSRTWLCRLKRSAREKTRRARDMPQIHICRFRKKAVDHVVKRLFSIQCTVDGRLTTLALAVLPLFVFPVHSIHAK